MKFFKLPSLSFIAYRIFGRFADLVIVYFEDLERDIKRAGMKISLYRYVSLMFFLCLISFFITFITSLIILISRMYLFYSITGSIGLGVLAFGITFWIMYLLPGIIANERRRKIDDALGFVTNYMAILSTSGVTPETIFKSLSTTNINKIIREEISDIVRRIEIAGESFYSAVRRKAEETPSKYFSDLLKGILMVSRTGGNLERFLRLQAKYLMRIKRAILRKGLDQLGIIAEVYVTAGIVLPIVMLIILSVMAILGWAGNVVIWLYLISFVLVPIISIVIIILIDSMIPKGE
jgi:flagellar protein FlaJ